MSTLYDVLCDPASRPIPVFHHDVEEKSQASQYAKIKVPNGTQVPVVLSPIIATPNENGAMINPTEITNWNNVQWNISRSNIYIFVAAALESIAAVITNAVTGRPRMAATASAAQYSTSRYPTLYWLGQAALHGYKDNAPLSTSDKAKWGKEFGIYIQRARQALERDFPNWNEKRINHWLGRLLGAMANPHSDDQALNFMRKHDIVSTIPTRKIQKRRHIHKHMHGKR